jgi:hypothetical protein
MVSYDAMSNESITTNLSPPQYFPPLRRSIPVLATQVLVAMLIAGAFSVLYIGLQKAPTPTRMPIAFASSQLADTAASALGDKVDVREAATPGHARQLVRTHEVVAALVPSDAGFALYAASANGRSATTAATAIAVSVAEGAGGVVTDVKDLVPLSASDSQGLSGFYLVFGTTLAAFVLAQVMYALAHIARLRVRVVVTIIGSVAAATVAATIAGPVYDAVPAALGPVIVVLSLLAVGVALSSLAISTLIGPMGNVVSTLVFTILGNAASGATISAFLMPPIIASIGAGLPPGAAFRAITAFSYFDSTNVAGPIATLAIWVAAAATVLFLARLINARKRRDSSVQPAS